jgi:ABC-type transport system involved in multi-copper enzyme maturation permease subunit
MLFLPIAGTGLRLFFRRRLHRILARVGLIPFGVMLLILIGPHVIDLPTEEFGPGAAAVFHVSGAGLYLYLSKWVWVFLFLLTALAGGLIANDLRANALEIYFSRPLSLFDYFLGKLLVILTVLLGLTLLPCLLLFLVDLTLTETQGFWFDQLHLLPRMAAACLLMTVPYGLIMLAISSIARTARNAMLLFAGLIMMTSIISNILTQSLEQPLFGLISINANMHRLMEIVLAPNPDHVNALSLGNRNFPLQDVPALYSAGVLAAIITFSVLLFFRRVRGVEVVSA